MSGQHADAAVVDPVPFTVGAEYTRPQIYDFMQVPEGQQRGNWETGYNRWQNDLFIFPTVGSAATGGYNYDNRWEGDDLFVWYAKEGTHLQQPLIQWMLHQARRIYVFTRPAVRTPFRFEGIGRPISWEDTSPVLIRWQIDRLVASDFESPDEVGDSETFLEGAKKFVIVNAYERSARARQRCIEEFGHRCAVCGFDFGIGYGEIGVGYIHVHHLRSITEIGAEYVIDPVRDLRPVCPNCHAMLHTARPPLSIEALQSRLRYRWMHDGATSVQIVED